VLGLLNFGSLGLIIGYSLSYIAGIGIGYKTFKKHFYVIKEKEELKKEFLINKNQILFSTPSILLNSLSFSVVVFFIGLLYSNEEVGIYGMAFRVLVVPVTIISAGLSKIFMQRANDYFVKYGNFRSLLIKFSFALLGLSIFLYFPFYFINEKIVVLILGKKWIDMINILKIMIPLFTVRLIVSTVSLSVIVLKKQQLELLLQGLFLVGTVITFLVSISFNLNFKSFIGLNSLILICSYAIFFIILYYFAKKKDKSEELKWN
ncbi:oligosaccharide flippase family protein, partial [Staphylococcus hominis]